MLDDINLMVSPNPFPNSRNDESIIIETHKEREIENLNKVLFTIHVQIEPLHVIGAHNNLSLIRIRKGATADTVTSNLYILNSTETMSNCPNRPQITLFQAITPLIFLEQTEQTQKTDR